MTRFDLVVIGGGPGGIAAVDGALRRGASVAMIQDGPIGGDCTWTGCVPSKALIAAASRGTTSREGFDEARRAIREVAVLEDAEVFRRRGATVIEGRGRLVGPSQVEVDGTLIDAGAVVVATGAVPVVPPIPGLRELPPLTSETLWELPEPPASLAILGGGPIGVELAQALARLGVRVTLFEAVDRILGREEPETAAVLSAALAGDGVDVRVATAVDRVERRPDGSIDVWGERADAPVVVDEVLVAIGRRPVTDGFDLDAVGVDVDDRGFVVTDDRMQTTAAGVYAVGDVNGRFPFTHGAHAQGLVAVADALGRRSLRRYSTRAEPFVTFTDPEIARVGLTEAEAFARWGRRARVVELPMATVDRAIAEGRTEGFVKLIAAPGRLLRHRAGGQLVGATILSPHAGEMIHELSLAMRLRLPPAVLALATHAYPTWGVAVQQALSGFFVDLAHGTTRPARP